MCRWGNGATDRAVQSAHRISKSNLIGRLELNQHKERRTKESSDYAQQNEYVAVWEI